LIGGVGVNRLAAHGVSLEVPAGWEAELSTQQDPAALDPDLQLGAKSQLVVVHAANFSLPTERGDYGRGAVEAMDANSIFVTLIEFPAASVDRQLFAAAGLPTRLRPADFAADQVQRSLPGQAGVQRFFHVGAGVKRRPFCLYAVLGAYSKRAMLVAELNRLLSSFSFY